MKGKKYSIEKIIQILSEAKMTSVTAVCRKYNICTSTILSLARQLQRSIFKSGKRNGCPQGGERIPKKACS